MNINLLDLFSGIGGFHLNSIPICEFNTPGNSIPL